MQSTQDSTLFSATTDSLKIDGESLSPKDPRSSIADSGNKDERPQVISTEEYKAPSQFDDAIASHSQALERLPQDHKDRLFHLSSLANSFLARFQSLGDLQDAKSALDALHATLDSLPENDKNRPVCLLNIGGCLLIRFERAGEPKDLDDAIACLHEGLDSISKEHALAPPFSSHLGCCLNHRFELHGDSADSDQAVAMLQTAVDLTPEDHPERQNYLKNLSNALLARFERFGESSDIDTVLSIRQQAVDYTPNIHVSKASKLNGLASALYARFERFGDLADISNAIVTYQHAVDLSPVSHPDMPLFLMRLGNAYGTRFTQTADPTDIDRAMVAHRRAVEHTAQGNPSQSVRLCCLGNSLRDRFEFKGDLTDIDTSIAALRLSIDLFPARLSDLIKSDVYNNLGLSYFARFERLLESGDLNSALPAYGQAANLTPLDHPRRPSRLSNAAIALLECFKLRGQGSDLDTAVNLLQEAVGLTSNEPNKLGFCSNLGIALQTRFKMHRNREDLDSAIETLKIALDLAPEGHAFRPMLLDNLSDTLLIRFEQFGDVVDVEDSVALRTEAIKLAPENQLLQSLLLSNLGRTWRAQLHSESPRQKAHFESALDCFQRAANYQFGAPRVKLVAALASTALCADYPDFVESAETLIRAHTSVIKAIEPFIWIGQSITQRIQHLSIGKQIGDAVLAAVAAALSVGKPELALEWFEEGRNVVWGQILRLKSPVDELQIRHPDLADRVARVSAALESGGRTDNSTWLGVLEDVETWIAGRIPARTRILESGSQSHHQQAKEYERLIGDVRKLEGFENFLRPKSFAELAHTSRDSTVVAINLHSSRCDAIVLCRAGHIVHVPLPTLSFKSAQSLHSKLASHISGASKARSDRALRHDRADSSGNIIHQVLKVLWLDIVQPILSEIKDELRDGRTDRLPHITWCTTGPLAFLPLHAAGIYDDKDPLGSAKTSDFVVSSYTPSISALATANSRRAKALATAAAGEARKGVLIISQPETPGQSALPSTRDEAQKVEAHFAADRVTHLDGTHAEVETVFQAMAEHEWVHFACHAFQDVDDPTQSGFYLHDGKLELVRLISMAHSQAEMAVLSACQTATGDETLPEEAVHLAAGMLAAGYQSVIATMWSIADADGPVLSDALYAVLKRDLAAMRGVQPAYALHEAVAALQERVGQTNFLRWVPFVHFGY